MRDISMARNLNVGRYGVALLKWYGGKTRGDHTLT